MPIKHLTTDDLAEIIRKILKADGITADVFINETPDGPGFSLDFGNYFTDEKEMDAEMARAMKAIADSMKQAMINHRGQTVH